MLSDAPSRMALRRSLSSPDDPVLAPMLSNVESAAAFEQFAPMIIDAILQPGITFGVRTRLAFQHDRAAVGHDEAVPGQQDAALTEADAIVILAEQPRALWHQQDAARGAVIDVLRDLGGDLARQIGTDAGDERGRE